MSYKEQLYKNALKEIQRIYKESQYNPNVDLYRSFDIINSVNDNQIASKEWLADKIIPYIEKSNHKRVCLLGGWYGVLGIILKTKYPDVELVSVDSDDECIILGKNLTAGICKINFKHEDALDYMLDIDGKHDIIINTSCEHMEKNDIILMNNLKGKHTIVCLQSNNYHSIQSHINTYDSLNEFVDSLKLSEIFYKEEMEAPGGEYNRYMVIGR